MAIKLKLYLRQVLIELKIKFIIAFIFKWGFTGFPSSGGGCESLGWRSLVALLYNRNKLAGFRFVANLIFKFTLIP